MGTWAARTVWCAQSRNSNRQVRSYLVNTWLCAVVMVILLVIDRVEKNPGPDVEGESFMQVMCSGHDTSLKSRIQCNSCGRWFHNSCGNIKAQLVDSGKWNCERYKWESFVY